LILVTGGGGGVGGGVGGGGGGKDSNFSKPTKYVDVPAINPKRSNLGDYWGREKML